MSSDMCTEPLRKHAYSNILKISPPKTEKFSDKNSDIFHISARNIHCGYSLEPPRRGGSNEYLQSMFIAEIRKIMCTPVNSSFIILKWGLRRSKLYRYVFVVCMPNEYLNQLEQSCSQIRVFVVHMKKNFASLAIQK